MWLYHKLPYRRIPLLLLCKEDWIIHHTYFDRDAGLECTVFGTSGEYGPAGETVEKAIRLAEEAGWTFSSKEGWNPLEQRT
jgi:hypothetical protein